MPKVVVNGAVLQCTMGVAPGTLTVLPTNKTQGVMQNAATVMDFQPNVNIAPFGMCQSPSNPQVAAATAAAMGVLTPQPCVPVTTSPWTPGSSTVKINNLAALTDPSTCMCTWAGTISITSPGETTVEIDG
jgi:Domain of unknown function (DUF4280)